ncbi:Myb-like DNA-binding domain-containing protein [Spironucleus salmonicida]|uniref:Myb-like DNA-binding domain-containing protein n=1 Tax=Spironucleus salmonicida TaxID=348837 RepID=V6LF34_9EUKA|nr:Myb-like DNA-binding domain-containing protein [Spironucleus salmonicida]|eukprot:EST42883.1 Myb-like DNA-binding domain-containing protein [Spironucleus salmonicida]
MVNYHWTDVEEVTLCNLVKAQGKQWNNIQQIYFPQLTVNQIKFKFYYLQKKAEKKQDICDDIKEFIVNDDTLKRKSRHHLLNEIIQIFGNQ